VYQRGQKLDELIGACPAELQVQLGRIHWIKEYADTYQELVWYRNNSGAVLLVIK
jgi:hypothetical protein